jgi:hypothetical protein
VLIRVHNSLKEITRSLTMSLLPPVQEEKTLVLLAGADLKLEDYRIEPNLSIVFQIIYYFSAEMPNGRVSQDKYLIGEYYYLPEIVQGDMKDQYFESSVDPRAKRGTLFDDHWPLSLETPIMTSQAPEIRLSGLVSARSNITAEIRRGLIENLIQSKVQKTEDLLVDNIGMNIELELQKQRELIKAVDQSRRRQNRVLEEIEKIKFKQDVRTGLSYFDQVNSMSRQAGKEIEELRKRYEFNLLRLTMILNEQAVEG